jgi:hypothetical protein
MAEAASVGGLFHFPMSLIGPKQESSSSSRKMHNPRPKLIPPDQLLSDADHEYILVE